MQALLVNLIFVLFSVTLYHGPLQYFWCYSLCAGRLGLQARKSMRIFFLGTTRFHRSVPFLKYDPWHAGGEQAEKRSEWIC